MFTENINEFLIKHSTSVIVRSIVIVFVLFACVITAPLIFQTVNMYHDEPEKIIPQPLKNVIQYADFDVIEIRIETKLNEKVENYLKSPYPNPV